jgi:hypothetical protein
MSGFEYFIFLSWVELSTFVTLVLNSTHDKKSCTHLTKSKTLTFFSLKYICFFFVQENCEVIARMPGKRTKQSSITSMGFPRFFFRRPQGCVWTDRSRFLDPTGKDTCEMKKRIHCTSTPCTSIMRCTSGIQVVHPLKQWSCRRWVWIVMVSSIMLYHSLSPIPNTLYRCIRLHIKNQHGRVGRVYPFGNIRR